eukprot:tig00021569_g22344.t1
MASETGHAGGGGRGADSIRGPKLFLSGPEDSSLSSQDSAAARPKSAEDGGGADGGDASLQGKVSGKKQKHLEVSLRSLAGRGEAPGEGRLSPSRSNGSRGSDRSLARAKGEGGEERRAPSGEEPGEHAETPEERRRRLSDVFRSAVSVAAATAAAASGSSRRISMAASLAQVAISAAMQSEAAAPPHAATPSPTPAPAGPRTVPRSATVIARDDTNLRDLLLKKPEARTIRDLSKLLVHVREARFFQQNPMDESVLLEICRCLSYLRRLPGEHVFLEGEEASTFYIVLGGTAEVWKHAGRRGAAAGTPRAEGLAPPAAARQQRRRSSVGSTLVSGDGDRFEGGYGHGLEGLVSTSPEPPAPSPRPDAAPASPWGGGPPPSRVLLACLKAGDAFGELALIKSEPRSASVTAGEAGPLELAVLDRRDFDRTLRRWKERELAGKLEYLRRFAAFHALRLDRFTKLASVFSRRSVPRHTVLMEEGRPVPGIFVLRSGCCRVSREVELSWEIAPQPVSVLTPQVPITQRPRVPVALSVLAENSILGVHEVLLERPAGSTVVAETACELLYCPRAELLAHLTDEAGQLLRAEADRREALDRARLDSIRALRGAADGGRARPRPRPPAPPAPPLQLKARAVSTPSRPPRRPAPHPHPHPHPHPAPPASPPAGGRRPLRSGRGAGGGAGGDGRAAARGAQPAPPGGAAAAGRRARPGPGPGAGAGAAGQQQQQQHGSSRASLRSWRRPSRGGEAGLDEGGADDRGEEGAGPPRRSKPLSSGDLGSSRPLQTRSGSMRRLSLPAGVALWPLVPPLALGALARSLDSSVPPGPPPGAAGSPPSASQTQPLPKLPSFTLRPAAEAAPGPASAPASRSLLGSPPFGPRPPPTPAGHRCPARLHPRRGGAGRGGGGPPPLRVEEGPLGEYLAHYRAAQERLLGASARLPPASEEDAVLSALLTHRRERPSPADVAAGAPAPHAPRRPRAPPRPPCGAACGPS